MSRGRKALSWLIGIAGGLLAGFFLVKDCVLTAWFIGAAALAAVSCATREYDD